MKTFPVLWQGSSKYYEVLKSLGCPKDVPWEFIEARRAGCIRNHDQTPERLAERGGLAPQELIALEATSRDERRAIWSSSNETAVTRLLELLSKHANLSKCSGTESGYHVVVHGARACRICGEIVYPDARDIEIARLRSENERLSKEYSAAMLRADVIASERRSWMERVDYWSNETVNAKREVSREKISNEHTQYWYACRWERLKDLVRGTELEQVANSIMANGTADPAEPPTYAQQLNKMRFRAERAERELSILQADQELAKEKNNERE